MMTTSDAPAPTKATTAPKQTEEPSPISLVEAAFPEREGRLRKVLPLWSTYFRVNFHDPKKSNYIMESHFVHVSGDEVNEMK
jgi:hypothetical protein